MIGATVATVRPGRDRRRARRVRGGDPGRAARDEGGLRREEPHAWAARA